MQFEIKANNNKGLKATTHHRKNDKLQSNTPREVKPMPTLPHLTSDQTYTIVSIEPKQNLSLPMLGYYLTSTATINVEDLSDVSHTSGNSVELENIAKYLIKSSQPELVLHIHGYANSESDAKIRYKQTYDDIKKLLHPTSKNHVFVGYRWPAENPKSDNPQPGTSKPITFLDKVRYALQALPTLLLGTLIISLVFTFVTIFLLLWSNAASNFILTSLVITFISSVLGIFIRKVADATELLVIKIHGVILVFLALLIPAIGIYSPIFNNLNLFLSAIIVISVFLLALVVTLMALRLSTYLRDRSRASNYGVMDLVKFFQELEKAILNEQNSRYSHFTQWKLVNEEKIEGDKIRIKVSFIAHSLGCEVATQTIRILSDVFDPNALSNPSSKIGNVFSLGRLVLVAADIPLESILSSRSNYLQSSLRRCEEAYVFCNEADLALRLASTAANYFSFPYRTRFRGYKLGNVTVNRQSLKQKLNLNNYGVCNCIDDDYSNPNNPHEHLEVRASGIERKSLNKLIEKNNSSHEIGKIKTEKKEIADYFTYFDCTDYQEKSNQGILSFSKKQSALNTIDYIRLIIAYFFGFPRRINVHGGYFDGDFCRLQINELAFFGYQGILLRHLGSSRNKSDSSLFNNLTHSQQNDLFKQFSEDSQKNYIQVLLASKQVPNATSERNAVNKSPI
ncbi:MAG: alpha/beta hydrolase [Nostoc sp. JL33]|uniref:alpha/beta hydrolase n=1 Tax=Nostoc sp. JL33 TaxID=2815396 RepID=UPI0025D8C34D|nr:alpha/beta hydrolase [Nostoc sp. JL33]MBN3868773.1 alpha/beta hydrolase [Nostoc sp. JL33]